MAAATGDRDPERQPSERVNYTGASGYTYYKGTLVMKDITGAIIRPAVQGAGASNAVFLGVANNRVSLGAGLGSSQAILEVYKRGEFTFVANGTGASSDIGKRAYALDDQTVGVSIATPCLMVGEIVGVPTSSKYRVRIDNAIGLGNYAMGVSFAPAQN